VGERLVALTDSVHHPQIRLAALDAASTCRSPGVDRPAVLLDRLTHDTVDDVFAVAADLALADPGVRPRAWPIIETRARADETPAEVRAAAVIRLGAATGSAGAAEAVRLLLRRDPAPVVVAAAARAAAELGLADGVELLLGRIDDQDPAIQTVVIQAAGRRVPDAETVWRALLSRARTAGHAEVRRAAVEALAAAAHLAEVREVLLDRTRDDDFSVRDTAERLLTVNPRWEGSTR
jgi:HEAT repeat protein